MGEQLDQGEGLCGGTDSLIKGAGLCGGIAESKWQGFGGTA